MDERKGIIFFFYFSLGLKYRINEAIIMSKIIRNRIQTDC